MIILSLIKMKMYLLSFNLLKVLNVLDVIMLIKIIVKFVGMVVLYFYVNIVLWQIIENVLVYQRMKNYPQILLVHIIAVSIVNVQVLKLVSYFDVNNVIWLF